MFERTQVKEGMVVRSQDGEKLGRVSAVGEDAFHIEKGLFFPKDYLVRFSEVAGVRDGELVLSHGRASLRALSSEERHGAPGAGDRGYLAARAWARARWGSRTRASPPAPAEPPAPCRAAPWAPPG
jgi:hypothetical protein